MAYVAIHMADNAYLRKTKTGWVTTPNITAAFVHPAKRQIEDAIEMLRSVGINMDGWSISDTKSATKLIRGKGCTVRTIYDIFPQEKEIVRKPVNTPVPLSCSVIPHAPSSDHSNQVIGHIDQINHLISDTYMNELSIRMSEADKSVVDIYHYIEAANFNACQGYKLCKRLQKALIHRRTIKNEYTLLNRIRQCNIPTQSNLKAMAEKQWQPQVDVLTLEDL